MSVWTRFKMRTLIGVTFCAFITFYTVTYVMKLTEKCEKDDGARYKTSYFYYNITEMTSQILKPSGGGGGRGRASTLGYKMRTVRSMAFGFTEGVLYSKRSMMNDVIVSSSSSRTEWYDTVYESRRKNMQTYCRKYFHPEEVLKVKEMKLNHILIDHRHKVLYCYVPKVACTNWKRIFLVLTGKADNISQVINLPSSEVHAKNLFVSLQNHTLAEVLKLTEEYTKFIFVRHPFERLLSAYRNKLEQHYDSSKYFQARFGKYIIRNFRKNPSNVSLERGDDVTFAEFVRYLISSDPRTYNEHWQRVTDLCHPCLLDYDFIGKYETLLKDSDHLLKRFGLNASFPVLAKPSTTANSLKRYYNTLGKSDIYKLYNIYKMDFRLFGYDLFNVSDWTNNW